MKSEWRVTSNLIAGEKCYSCYRLKDMDAVDHSGNREYAGTLYRDKADAQAVADEMNAKEAAE